MKKKILAILLLVTILTAMFPVTASATCSHPNITKYCVSTFVDASDSGHYVPPYGLCEYGV